MFTPCRQNLAKIKKTDKDSVRELCCKNIRLPVKLRDTHKVEKKKIVSASVFLVIKVRSKFQYTFQEILSRGMLI